MGHCGTDRRREAMATGKRLKCPLCGYTNYSYSYGRNPKMFCYRDGARLQVVEHAVRCRNCGNQLFIAEKFCHDCGLTYDEAVNTKWTFGARLMEIIGLA